MTHLKGGREAGDGSVILAAVARPPDELRAAQLAVASNVVGRFDNELTREFELRDTLEYLGLYRRI